MGTYYVGIGYKGVCNTTMNAKLLSLCKKDLDGGSMNMELFMK
jgi:hypothetical protein